MHKGTIKRLCALALAGWMLAGLALPGALAAQEGRISIATAEDWEAFAQNCALDAWSQGKTAVLTADLDLSGRAVRPIPTFGGTLLGQGHIISGLRLTGAGSNQGLFRYIQPGAVVQDLVVKGLVAPEGSRSTVGGLAGVNAGTIQNCVFQGAVTGESGVGGLVGRNGAGGQIINCSVTGTVNGQTATGGIAGRNAGLLLKCTNSAGVNLTERDTRQTLMELDPGAVLNDRNTFEEEETTGVLDGSTDTGGVAGYSNGIIQSCTNHGDVGYPHVGYNTGGIVGRQNGFLAGCVNKGTIHGRKDVGGIAGQAEPWLVLDPGPQTLDRLRTELDTLDRLVNQALNDAQSTGDRVSAHLTAMGDFTGTARESSKRLLEHTMDFVDDNVNEVNILAADVTNALDTISPAMDGLADVGRRLEQLSRQVDRALKELEGAVDISSEVFHTLRSSVNELRQGQTELDAACRSFQAALDHIHNAVFPGGFPALPSPEELAQARENLRSAFQNLRSAGDSLARSLSDLQRALGEAERLSKPVEDALEDLRDAADSSAAIGRLLESAFDAIGDEVDQLTRNGPAQFTNLGEAAREASDSLYDALGGLSSEMEELNRTVQSGSDTLTGDLRAVSRQFNIVCNVMMDAIEDLDERRQEGAEGFVQDTSDEDIAATREGKVADCRNAGAVEGDRNVGGIVGSVAIELDLDPEDDRADRLSFGSTYETKAVVQGCLNRGKVTAKKDCAGGIAGRMDLGTALECQNYGPVASTSGDYTGGVAGFADAIVRSCFSKSTLSGKNYVGGVAGWASHLRDCVSIATIEEGTEYLGAVAGGVETDGVLTGNRFVDTGVAGVDGVSYAGRAEPVLFAELTLLPDVPPEFTAFTLTLLAEGETVAQLPFFYGDDLSRLVLPEVPAQEGFYGRWPEFDRSGVNSDITVEAVYAPWVTLIASQETEGKLSLALAEGQFTHEAVLHVEESAMVPPGESGEDGVVWAVSLTGTGLTADDLVPLRLLNPAEGNVSLWQYREGHWVSVEPVRSGRYLMLDMEGTEGVFCIQPQEGSLWMLLPAGGALALVLLALALLRKRRKPANKPGGKSQAAEPETAAK